MQCFDTIGATSWYQVARGTGSSSPGSSPTSVPQAATRSAAAPRSGNVNVARPDTRSVPHSEVRMPALHSKARTRESASIAWKITTTVWGKPTQAAREFTLPGRYSLAVSRLSVLGIALGLTLGMTASLVSCGPPTTGVKTGGTGGGTATGSAKAAGSGSAAGMATGSGGIATIPDVGCLAPGCVYHAGTGAYFTCLAGGAGACFHFGGPCAPSDGCMYDAADRSYKQCTHAVEGKCDAWGAACAPASRCMFSPSDGLHHTCDEVAGGGCRTYGALCSP